MWENCTPLSVYSNLLIAFRLVAVVVVFLLLNVHSFAVVIYDCMCGYDLEKVLLISLVVAVLFLLFCLFCWLYYILLPCVFCVGVFVIVMVYTFFSLTLIHLY